MENFSTCGGATRADPTRRPAPGHRVREGFAGQRLTTLPRAAVEQARQLPAVGDLYVTDIGHFPAAPGHYVHRPSGTGETILIYCLAGDGWAELGGREWPMRPGWALAVPPGVAHSYGADADRPWAIWWTHFGGARAAAFLTLLSMSAEQPLLYAPGVPRVARAFEEAYDHLHHGYSEGTLVGLSTGLTHVLGLLKVLQQAPQARARRGEARMRRSIAFMRERLGEPLRLADLAAAVGMSPAHYSALFRRATGSSPCQYLTQLKIRRACELLDTTALTVAEVARAVGYADSFYFSRVFKQTVGRAPVHYREAVKG